MVITENQRKVIWAALCKLLLRITSFALICAEISRSSFCKDSAVGFLFEGTLTILALPPLFAISLAKILLILINNCPQVVQTIFLISDSHLFFTASKVQVCHKTDSLYHSVARYVNT